MSKAAKMIVPILTVVLCSFGLVTVAIASDADLSIGQSTDIELRQNGIAVSGPVFDNANICYSVAIVNGVRSYGVDSGAEYILSQDNLSIYIAGDAPKDVTVEIAAELSENFVKAFQVTLGDVTKTFAPSETSVVFENVQVDTDVPIVVSMIVTDDETVQERPSVEDLTVTITAA